MRPSLSLSFNPKERNSSLNGTSLDEFYNKGGTSNCNQKTNLRKRRMSINHYKKEKSIVVILVLVTVMFTFATIPSGLVRILQSLHPECELKDSFQVISKTHIYENKIGTYLFFLNSQVFKHMANMLELANASVNFYMYCLCNKEIRTRAVHILCSTVHFWKTDSSSINVPAETSHLRK